MGESQLRMGYHLRPYVAKRKTIRNLGGKFRLAPPLFQRIHYRATEHVTSGVAHLRDPIKELEP